MSRLVLLLALLSTVPQASRAQASRLSDELDRRVMAINPQVVAWRRDLHEHPELGMQERRTAALVAGHLRKLGLEVRTGVGGTGVVGVLKGGKPGKVVALRADMDALPVTEMVDLPFKSKVRTTWNGQETGVMHACGHDNHVAILMGTAEVLAGMRTQIAGTVVFLFQPAEEGPGGAKPMISDGAMDNPKVDAVFGLHVWPLPAGDIAVRPGPTMAAANSFHVTVRGRQTHGAAPWSGVDPVVVSAQIITALQTVVNRQVNVTELPAIVTVAMVHGGVRENIIPDTVRLDGTIRTFGEAQKRLVHGSVQRIVTQVAASLGASATVTIDSGYPVTDNDPALTERMMPTLRRVVGPDRLRQSAMITGAEDFSLFQQKAPGVFLFLGIVPRDQDPTKAPANHSPYFFADESALPVGVRAMTALALDYLGTPPR